MADLAHIAQLRSWFMSLNHMKGRAPCGNTHTHRTIHRHHCFLDLNFSTQNICCLRYFDFVCYIPISCKKPLLDFLIYRLTLEIDGPVWCIVDLDVLVEEDHPRGISLHTRKILSCPRASLVEMNIIEMLIVLFVDTYRMANSSGREAVDGTVYI